MAPMGQMMTDGVDLVNILHGLDRVHISQKADVVEAVCPCCNTRNTYTGYAGPFKNLPEGATPAPAVFIAKEDSSCCERVWCCGKHGFVLRFHQAVPDGLGGYTPGAVLNTMERKGVCNGKPCLGCWYCLGASGCPFAMPCTEGCLEEMNMYKGNQTIEQQNPNDLIFQVKQTACHKSLWNFQLEVFAPGKAESSMTVQGPCFFGGWKSMCLGDDFKITDARGQVGKLEKRSPESCMDCLREICTNADDYSVQFTPQPGMTVTPEQKLAMASAAFAADFMIFEKDPGPCFCDCYDKSIVCTICNCMICGRFQSCTVRISANGDISFGCC